MSVLLHLGDCSRAGVPERPGLSGGDCARMGLIGSARNVHGFTMVELMVTVAVAATLLMIAVPSFRSMLATNQLNTAANELVGGLSEARMEAIQRNAGAQFCSNSSTNNTTDTLGKGALDYTKGVKEVQAALNLVKAVELALDIIPF